MVWSCCAANGHFEKQKIYFIQGPPKLQLNSQKKTKTSKHHEEKQQNREENKNKRYHESYTRRNAKVTNLARPELGSVILDELVDIHRLFALDFLDILSEPISNRSEKSCRKATRLGNDIHVPLLDGVPFVESKVTFEFGDGRAFAEEFVGLFAGDRLELNLLYRGSH